MRRFTCIFLVITLWFAIPAFARRGKSASSKTLPVTTSSPKARDLYQRAMQDYENLYLERSNVGWRAATQADPNFALAWAWIAFNSRNPAEASAAREKAKGLEANITPGERLMVEWIVNAQQNNFIAGIAAMNDMLAMYPKDKHLLYLAANWMVGANSSYDRAEELLRRALDLDKNYPAALNDIAYVYARTRQFNKAFDAMERYIAVLPTEPNPHDSYAEILRMSGNFDGALQHYRAALKIDPTFITSQLGLGDTYALMGNEAQARDEYDKAIAGAHTDADRLDYRLQKAMTWVRENNLAEADKALDAVAADAHAGNFESEEAEAYLMKAMYQADDTAALKDLEAAEQAAMRPSAMSESERQEKHARILSVRVTRSAHAGDQALAQATLRQLELMANSTRDGIVQQAYHGAAGALLMSGQKYAEAIPHLEEDQDNPYSMQLLSEAYSKTDAFDKMHETEARLRGTNVPTMAQALVVPAARSRRPQAE